MMKLLSLWSKLSSEITRISKGAGRDGINRKEVEKKKMGWGKQPILDPRPKGRRSRAELRPEGCAGVFRAERAVRGVGGRRSGATKTERRARLVEQTHPEMQSRSAGGAKRVARRDSTSSSSSRDSFLFGSLGSPNVLARSTTMSSSTDHADDSEIVRTAWYNQPAPLNYIYASSDDRPVVGAQRFQASTRIIDRYRCHVFADSVAALMCNHV